MGIRDYGAATDRLVEAVMKALSCMLVAVSLLTWTVGNAQGVKKEKVRVAFVISDGFDVIDFAGPWEGFQEVTLGSANDSMVIPYELYRVSIGKGAVPSSEGATVVPQHALHEAPAP